MHPFTLRQLEYIVAVADTGNFGRAATQCAVSQPSLSAQIAQVEDLLGLKLFERGRHGARVDRRAEAFIAAARILLGRADDLVRLAAGVDPFAGDLRLGVIPTIAPFALPAVSAALAEKWPKLRPIWTEERTPRLVAMVESGQLDAALLAVEADLGTLDTIALAKDPFLLAVAKDHPLAKKKSIPGVEALAGLPLLVLEDGHCLRDQTLAACGRAAPDEATAAFRATSLATLVELVVGGVGATLLPALALRDAGRHPRLATVPFAAHAPARTLGLAVRPGAPIGETLKTLAPTFRDALN